MAGQIVPYTPPMTTLTPVSTQMTTLTPVTSPVGITQNTLVMVGLLVVIVMLMMLLRR